MRLDVEVNLVGPSEVLAILFRKMKLTDAKERLRLTEQYKSTQRFFVIFPVVVTIFGQQVQQLLVLECEPHVREHSRCDWIGRKSRERLL